LRGRFRSDQAGDVGAFEAGVDVHDGHVRRTGVEHAQQSGKPAQVRSVTDARGHGNDGTIDIAADDARQRPFHAGNDDNGIGPCQLRQPGGQAMRSEGENVLDLFGGSGSTLIACQQTGRKAFLMELDPLYADVIVQRWEKFTGGKAERVAA
jgi:hypothetical protein